MKEPYSYAKAGVDIAQAEQTKEVFAATLETKNPLVLNRVGAFASLIDGKFSECKHPVLVLKMEEPGSKQLLAAQHGRLAGIGFDLVNHLINDVVVMGAKPVAVLDTIVCGKLEKENVVAMVAAMAQACRDQRCDLVGGETSEQPRVIPSGSYILSASALGVVDRDKIIDGAKVQSGDLVVAVASNGVHTNGYSLIRSLIDRDATLPEKIIANERFIDHILRPHLCYSNALQDLFAGADSIHALAHITGGGIDGNLKRVIPAGLSARIDLSKIRVLPIFEAIKEAGGIEQAEMLKTYNLGVGLIAVIPQHLLSNLSRTFAKHGHDAYVIGDVQEGAAKVAFEKSLSLTFSHG